MAGDPSSSVDAADSGTTATASGADGTGVFGRDFRRLTLGVLLAVSIVAFEALGVATVLPVAARELDGLGSFGWGLSALMLANIVGAVVASHVASRRGAWPPFTVATLVFIAGCLLAAIGPSWIAFLGGRAVQGLGVGGVMAIAFMSIGATYPDHLQARMYALVSSAWTIPALAGPPIAGLLSDTIGWRWVFVIVAPVALLAGIFAAPALRRLAGHVADGDSDSRGARPVFYSVVLVAGSVVLLLALETVQPVLLIVGVLVGLAVAAVGFRHVTPAGALVVRRGVAAGIVARLLLSAAFFGTEAFIPLGLSELRGTGTTLSGISLAIGAVTWVAGSFLQERLDRGGTSDRARASALGAAVLAAGTVGVALGILVPAVPYVVTLVGWGIGGVGMGVAFNASTAETMRLASSEELGIASSSLQLSQTLGTAVLAGLGGGLLHLVTAWNGPFALAMAITFGVTIVLALLTALVSRRLRPSLA